MKEKIRKKEKLLSSLAAKSSKITFIIPKDENINDEINELVNLTYVGVVNELEHGECPRVMDEIYIRVRHNVVIKNETVNQP